MAIKSGEVPELFVELNLNILLGFAETYGGEFVVGHKIANGGGLEF